MSGAKENNSNTEKKWGEKMTGKEKQTRWRKCEGFKKANPKLRMKAKRKRIEKIRSRKDYEDKRPP